ncbi:3'(2'),5'-bisphosphate nucleotidase CysQ [Hydrococcus rivularis NIES-593]|uniref:inositol-phosphate phosphatase n=1 Tax=Hydrococcus rivularis NIES-593 TaxID=1921803 RepID=A0A1U7HR71_9CYAN|nr:inositol monophosphatase family protein [Hydrococcus rivularis]OKH26093.1 3'(2'),5'-bisphosphate nucleotidase CysQ [Hydrococcus rivularis NIES-593]
MVTLDTDWTVNLEKIAAIARSVGWGAADILRSYYHSQKNPENLELEGTKKDGPVTAADLATNHYILEKLQASFGVQNFGYLSEETHQGTDPVPFPWVWIIDPLDGTRDFIDKTGEYAIHIALTYQGRPVVAIVAVPEAEKLYFAIKDKGTCVETLQGEVAPIRVSERNNIEDLSLVVSRTHRDERFQKLIDRLPIKGRNYVGSVGCKIATILEQHSDIYISLSGKSAPKDWDFAAPELILTEAGGKFTHFNGDPLTYNKGDVRQWGGLLASNGLCHEMLCQKAIELLEQIDAEG